MTSASWARIRVLALLVLLFGITYLDRVCISVAGPRIQEDLHIDPVGWGWVTGVFAISYGLFEIPSGILGDRLGPRRVLTRIVLWWSACTALTGAALGFYPLLAIRFLFGAGEAGAFPNAAVVIARWFAPTERATVSGVALMASQLGGALAPLLVVPIQSRFGWRASFYVFGALGACWAAAWYAGFRDSPPGGGAAAGPARAAAGTHPHGFPWRGIARSPSALALLATAFCYVYVYNFFQTWFHTFLVKGRGFSEAGLALSALPFLVAVFANLAGGALSDLLVRRLGARRGRRTLGAAALAVAGVFTLAAMVSRQPIACVLCLTVVYGAITFQQSGVFGVCLDIGGRHAGAMVGLMNTGAQIGGLVGSVAYGYLVEHFGNYDAPFVPMAGILFLGALLWFRVDASGKVEPARAGPWAGALD